MSEHHSHPELWSSFKTFFTKSRFFFIALTAAGAIFFFCGLFFQAGFYYNIALVIFGFIPFLAVVAYRKSVPLIWIAGPLSFLVLLGCLEFAFRIGPAQNRYLSKNVGKDFDTHTLLSWIPKNDNPKEISSPKGIVPIDQVDLVLSEKSEDQVRRHFDRIFAGYTKNKPPGVFRVITMGGSNAAGYGIENPKDRMTAQLQALFEQSGSKIKSEFIPAGVPGYSMFHNLLFYILEVSKYNPDVVILYCNINDATMRSAPYTYRELFKKKTGISASGLLDTNGNLPEGKVSIPALQDQLQKSRLYNFFSRYVLEVREEIVTGNSGSALLQDVNPVADYPKNIQDIVRAVTRDGADLILADAYYFNGMADENDGQSKTRSPFLRKMMAKQAGQDNVAFVSVHRILAEKEDFQSFVFYPEDPLHLNEKGHKLVAEILFDTLHRNFE